jgi:hypothetical protein
MPFTKGQSGNPGASPRNLGRFSLRPQAGQGCAGRARHGLPGRQVGGCTRRGGERNPRSRIWQANQHVTSPAIESVHQIKSPMNALRIRPKEPAWQGAG